MELEEKSYTLDKNSQDTDNHMQYGMSNNYESQDIYYMIPLV